MKINYIIFVLFFILSSCTKEPADIVDVNTDPVDTVDPNNNPADTFIIYTYQGSWRYEDLIIQNGIIHIDTTYTGELELCISTDSIKRNAGTFLEDYLAKTSLINDSMVYMRKICQTCKYNSRIKMSPDEKSVTYFIEYYSQGSGGPAKYTFEGMRN